jgi:predicted dehydrogenase
MKKKIRVAVIGCGNIGKKRIEAIAKDRNSKIIYLVNKKNSNILKKIASSTGAIFLNNFDKIDFEKIDAAVLCTTPEIFFLYGKKILIKKKHLLIEKPLALNLNQARLLTKISVKNHVVLKTGFNHRFDEGIFLAKKLVKNNKIGKIYYIKIDYANGSVRTNKNRIGSLLDIGCHSINLISFFFNEKKLTVIKSIKNRFEFSVKNKDDNGFLLIKFKKIFCSIHHSFLSWKNKFLVEISGSKGMIRINSLPKWGLQELILYRRKYPSGKPKEKKYFFKHDDSWKNEWSFFCKLINRKNLNHNYEGYDNMKYIFKKNNL